MQIFVTGTTSKTGKTFVSASLAAIMQSLGYKAGVYKPFQSGAIEQNSFLISPDLNYVKKLDFYVETHCSYLFKEQCALPIAAKIQNTEIDIKTVVDDYEIIKQKCETLIVEGTSGLMEPVVNDKLMGDVAKQIDIPILIVTKPDFDTINHTLLTINYAKSIGLDIAGVILNQYPTSTNDIAIKTIPRLIEEYSDANILGIIPEIPNCDIAKPSDIINVFINSVDIEKIFRIKIPKLNIGI